MSKIGEKSILIPSEVDVKIDKNVVTIKGPKGEMVISFHKKGLSVKREGNELRLYRDNDESSTRALHGLYRSLVANAVMGVVKEWEKRLEVVGTGFNVKQQGEDIVFRVGYSHPVVFKRVPGTALRVEGNTKLIVSGVDKQLVGQVAYQIKSIRMPDPYKGKGIRYEGEIMKLKPGKKAKAAAS